MGNQLWRNIVNTQILNGDHAEYELENQSTPPEQRSDWPLPSFDARDWAKAFMVVYDNGAYIDEALMVGWFANALMRGFDEERKRDTTGVRTGITELSDTKCHWCGKPLLRAETWLPGEVHPVQYVCTTAECRQVSRPALPSDAMREMDAVMASAPALEPIYSEARPLLERLMGKDDDPGAAERVQKLEGILATFTEPTVVATPFEIARQEAKVTIVSKLIGWLHLGGDVDMVADAILEEVGFGGR